MRNGIGQSVTDHSGYNYLSMSSRLLTSQDSPISLLALVQVTMLISNVKMRMRPDNELMYRNTIAYRDFHFCAQKYEAEVSRGVFSEHVLAKIATSMTNNMRLKSGTVVTGTAVGLDSYIYVR
jgi:hypothetical protein